MVSSISCPILILDESSLFCVVRAPMVAVVCFFPQVKGSYSYCYDANTKLA